MAHKAIFAILLLLVPVLFPDLFRNPVSFHQRFITWDTRQYIDISVRGYTVGTPQDAFYPLWPACIWASTSVTGGNTVLAGYLLANLFSLVGLLLFHRLVWERHNLPLANRALLLLLVYPGSIFFCLPYSEALFLALLISCLHWLWRGNISAAALIAFFLPLARPIGVLVLPMIGWNLFRRRSPFNHYIACAAPLLGYICYLAVMYCYTGNLFEGYKAQETFPTHPSFPQMFDLSGFVRSFLDIAWIHDIQRSFIDRIMFLAFLVSLYWIARIDSEYFLYAILAGLIPALSVSLASYTRYSSLVFPLFIVWAQLGHKTRTFPFLLMFFFAIQCLFIVLHVSGRWSG